jgi:glycosyltransferase involved in cell wall biosynthesis
MRSGVNECAVRMLRRVIKALGWLRNAGEAWLQIARARLLPTRRLPEPPRIVLDAVFFQLHRTGIARVWESLMSEWSKNGFARHIVVLDRHGSAPRLPGFTYRAVTPLRRFDTEPQRSALESLCRAEDADLFVSTYYSTAKQTPAALYLYDMIPEVMGFDLEAPEWREKRRAIEYASAYVAISQSTANDLHRLYPASLSKPVIVAHNAVSAAFRPAAENEVAALRSGLDLPQEYVMFVGRRDVAYKNASLVVSALSLLETAERPALLFVGGAAELETEFEDFSQEGVVRIAHPTDAELVAAYSGARALLYPSRYEGFGLPMLEAFACGCPVVTCRNSSLPEVAGDAALYVSEDDPAELAEAVRRLGDPELRTRLRQRGFERVARFSWRQTAEEIEHFLRGLASEIRIE